MNSNYHCQSHETQSTRSDRFFAGDNLSWSKESWISCARFVTLSWSPRMQSVSSFVDIEGGWRERKSKRVENKLLRKYWQLPATAIECWELFTVNICDVNVNLRLFSRYRMGSAGWANKNSWRVSLFLLIRESRLGETQITFRSTTPPYNVEGIR